MASTYPNNWNTTIFPAGNNVDKLSGYLPELFARKTLKKFYEQSLLSRIVNTVYAPELKKFGDSIYVRQKPVPTIKDYTVGEDLDVEQLTAAEPIKITVDKAVYWNYQENDLTTVQTDLKQYMNEAAFEVSKKLQDKVEGGTIMDMVNTASTKGVAVGNAGATAGIVSKRYNLGTSAAPVTLTVGDASASGLVANMMGALLENNALSDGAKPFVVAPFIFANYLSQSELTAANITGDSTGVIRRGQREIGVVQGTEIYTTNYLTPTDSGSDKVFPIICGTLDAITFVMQITKTERIRRERQFGWLNRGLAVYGYELVKPEALSVAWVKFA